MCFGVLGPVRMLAGGVEVHLGGAGVRVLLALLLLDANHVVPLDRIADALWQDKLPVTARTIVQGYVSKLRKLLELHDPSGAVRILTRMPGYLLVIDPSTVDVHRARQLLAEARGKPAAVRAELLGAAAALWRGQALADIPHLPAFAELDELRLAVLSERIDADLEMGRDVELISELRELLAEHPFFERAIEQLMRALYRCGRRADALECYHEFRRRTIDELGVEPGPSLADLYQRVLRDDPGLASPIGARWSVTPAQLPAADLAFTGRDEEMTWLNGLLTTYAPAGAASVAVITGPAGVGKSALAIAWGHSVAGDFTGGQLFAALHGFDPLREPAEPSQVLERFLLALGVRADEVPEVLEERAALYRSLLAGKRVLVLLDDARDSAQIRPLLTGGGGSLVLVTSRNKLGGLLVHGGARLLALDTLNEPDAVRVIATSGARLPAQTARQLTALCGGLPLALRMVGARLAMDPRCTATRLIDELTDERTRLGVLNIEEEDTSVRAALDVSHRSLDSATSAALNLLGLVPGPWIGAHALAALGEFPQSKAQACLCELHEANLVVELTAGRFTMHDLIRLYAKECAESLSMMTRHKALRRLVDYYLAAADHARRQVGAITDDLDFARWTEFALPAIAGPAAALSWLDSEWPNILALQQHVAELGWHTAVWQLAAVAHDLRHAQPTRDEWVPMVRLGLASARAAKDRRAELTMLSCLCAAYDYFGDFGAELAEAEQSYQIAKELGDSAAIARGLGNIAGAYMGQRRYAEALRRFQNMLRLARLNGYRLGEANALNNIAQAEQGLGHHAEAIEHQSTALGLYAELGHQGSYVFGVANLAELYAESAQPELAERYARRAVELATANGMGMQEAFAREILGGLLVQRGEPDAARAELELSLLRYEQVSSSRAVDVRTSLERLVEA